MRTAQTLHNAKAVLAALARVQPTLNISITHKGREYCPLCDREVSPRDGSTHACRPDTH